MKLSILIAFTFISVSCKHRTSEVSQVEATRREQSAIDEGLPRLSLEFHNKGINFPPDSGYIRVIKPTPYRVGNSAQINRNMDGVLEIWATNKQNTPHTLIKTYSLCAKSGVYGPKRMEGDLQIPEGFYEIDSLNPASSFYLSMHVNYPNKLDKIKGRKIHQKSLGGDIMVHGLETNENYCGSVGCMAMNNESIKEVFMFGRKMLEKGKKLPIHIFPKRMNASARKSLTPFPPDKYSQSGWNSSQFEMWAADTNQTWDDLYAGYQEFEKNQIPPTITFSNENYVINGKSSKEILSSLQETEQFTSETGEIAGINFKPDLCLKSPESQILEKINSLRRNPLRASKALSVTAEWHTYDLKHNYGSNEAAKGCTLKSWSSKVPNIWGEVCYRGPQDHTYVRKFPYYIGQSYLNIENSYHSGSVTEVTFPTENLDEVFNQLENTSVISSTTYQSVGVGIGFGYTIVWLSSVPVSDSDRIENCAN